MGLLDSYTNTVRGFYSNMLNPTGYLSNNDVGYYVPYLNQGRIAKENLSYQQLLQLYNQQLQQQIFSREDTSIARRVADLKASGLSPVLSAGQGAGTGGTVSITAPQRGDYPDLVNVAMNLMKMEADVSATRAQEAYTKLQQQRAEQLLPAEIAQIEAGIKNADAQTYKTYQDAKKAKVEADNMTRTGTSGQNTLSQWYRDLLGTSNKAIETIKKDQSNKAKGKPVKPETEIDKALKRMNQQPLYEY